MCWILVHSTLEAAYVLNVSPFLCSLKTTVSSYADPAEFYDIGAELFLWQLVVTPIFLMDHVHPRPQPYSITGNVHGPATERMLISLKCL